MIILLLALVCVFRCLCFSLNLLCEIALTRSLDQQLGGIHAPGFGVVPRHVGVVEPVHSSVDAIVQLMPLFAKTRTRIWLLDLVLIAGLVLVLIVGVDLRVIGIVPASVMANSSTQRQCQFRRRVLRIG